MKKNHYAIVFNVLGTYEKQLSAESFTNKKKAFSAKKFYKACGHTNVRVVEDLRF